MPKRHHLPIVGTLLGVALLSGCSSELNRIRIRETAAETVAPPAGMELPDGSITTGWTSMADNLLLLHLNEEAFATSFTDSSVSAYTVTCTAPSCPESAAYGKMKSGAYFGGSQVLSTALTDIAITNGSFVTVEFWMFWEGINNVMPVGFNNYSLYFQQNAQSVPQFGFTTGSGDIWGINAETLRDRWVHVAAIFANGADAKLSRLFIDGEEQALSQVLGTTPNFTTNSPKVVSAAFRAGGWPTNTNNRFRGLLDEIAVYNRALDAATIKAHFDHQFPGE